jgi:hypothetical protein
MKIQRAAPFLVLFLAAVASQAQTPDDPLAPFGWFKDLAGSCWSGRGENGRPTDTQCYSVQFGRFLRGTIRLSGKHRSQGVESLEGDSVYAWNPQAKQVHYSLWASDGSYATGAMYVEGENLIFPPANPGAPNAMRFVWTRLDADSYLVTREKRQGKAWSKVLEVTYRRSEGKYAAEQMRLPVRSAP